MVWRACSPSRVAAVLGGARSWVAIAEHLAAATPEHRTLVGLARVPSESTLRRTLARVCGDALDRTLAAWMWLRIHEVEGRRVIAIDGKTVRGARTSGQSAPHLVAALEHTLGVVLGQVQVDAKSNEIPALRELLATLAPEDLAGAVVTADAMHTQTDTATAILDAGADYVLTVKRNQPGLYDRLAAMSWDQAPAHTETSTDRGRRVTRRMRILLTGDDLGFPGIEQVARMERTRHHGDQTETELVFLITSAPHLAAPPRVLAAWIQGHWAIENRLHWVRDVTYDEDRSQIRVGNGPRVMATLRGLATGLIRLAGHENIAKANRHYARHPNEALKLALTG